MTAVVKQMTATTTPSGTPRLWYGRGRGHLTDQDVEELPKGNQLKLMYTMLGNQESINNDTFHQLLYYSMVGHILKDGVQVFWGQKNCGFRHFICLVGPTSIGKSRAIFTSVKLLSKFQTHLLGLPFNPRVDPDIACIYPSPLSNGSPEGLADEVRKYAGGPYLYTEEFGKFLERGKTYMEGFDETMINIIDGAPIKNVTRSNPFFIANPQVSYVTATTKSRFLNKDYPISAKYSNGWLGRGVVYYLDVDHTTRDVNERQMEQTPRYNVTPVEKAVINSLTALYTLNRNRTCPTWGIEADQTCIETVNSTRDRLRKLTDNAEIFEGAITRNLQYAVKWAGIDTITSQLPDLLYAFATPSFFANGFKTYNVDFIGGAIEPVLKHETEIDPKTGRATKVATYIPRAVQTTYSRPYKILLMLNHDYLKQACDLLYNVFKTTVTLFYSSEYNDRIEHLLREMKKKGGLLAESDLLSEAGWVADRDYRYLINTMFRRQELVPIEIKGKDGYPANYLCDLHTRVNNKQCAKDKCPVGKQCPRWKEGN